MSKKEEFKSLDERMVLCQQTNRYLEEFYLKKRFEQSVKWYIRKAVKYKRIYFLFMIISIVLPAVATVLINIPLLDNNWAKPIITILTVLTSTTTTLLSLFRAKDKWIHFRYMAETLQSEYSLYIEGAKDYADDETKNVKFIENIEAMMSEEHNKWIHIVNDDKNSRMPYDDQPPQGSTTPDAEIAVTATDIVKP